jgi:bla regulator protein blaR1
MQAFLWAIAGNTLFAAFLAAMVWLASKAFHRRPALIHALWIIVLLKLVTPPLFDASRFFDESAPKSSAQPTQIAAVETELSPFETMAVLEEQLSRARSAKIAALNSQSIWPSVLVGVWVIGSVGFLLVALYRASRFSWLVHWAPLADEKLTAIAHGEAQRLGLSHAPAIKVVEACISPLVWQTPFSATIVLPKKLVNEIGPDQLRLLLAHELAHVLRGDALVRWFALIVLTIHWWNPIVWLAVRQIEAAQEACCDSLVLSASGASPKRYAEMLLTTVDFLAGQETPPPALAAGFTSGSSLKGRCEMILSKRTPFALARTTRWTLAVLGLAILPLSAPLFGQEEKKPSGDELAARVERIEKALEELKAMLGNRANEERVVREKLEVANAELAAKMKQRQAEEASQRDKANAARAQAEVEHARAMEALAKAKVEAERRPQAESADLHREIQAKVNAELARVQEQVARASKDAADVASKLAQEHGDLAAKQAEKMSAEIAAKIKDHVAHAEKMAKEHAEHAEKYAHEHGKYAQEHAEKIARDIERHAERIARDAEQQAEKLARAAEEHAKMAMEKDLPKIKEQMAGMQKQMKAEAEKLAKAAEELSKNPEMKEQLDAVKEKMGALKDHMKAMQEKEMQKLKEYKIQPKMKELRIDPRQKGEESPSDVKEKAKDEGAKAERREIEQQLRERERQIRDLQREVEKLRKELGGDDRARSPRSKKAGKAEDVPVLSKVPVVGNLFRKSKLEDEEPVEVEEIEMDIEVVEEIDVDADVDVEMDIEEVDDVIEVKSHGVKALLKEKSLSEDKEPLSAIEVLKRAKVRNERGDKDSAEKKNADAPGKQ